MVVLRIHELIGIEPHIDSELGVTHLKSLAVDLNWMVSERGQLMWHSFKLNVVRNSSVSSYMAKKASHLPKEMGC